MLELKILATLKKKFFHTPGHSGPPSPLPPFGRLAPPIWPPLSGHIFICISDEAVQSYFSSPISTNMSEGKSTNPRLQKGGQMGGRETGGRCDQVYKRIFVEVAKIYNSCMADSNSIKLLLPKQNWLGKWPSKLKSLFFRGSFTRLTFQVRRGPCLMIWWQY